MHRIVFGIEPHGYSRPRRRSRAEYYAEFSIRWLYNVAINNKKAGEEKKPGMLDYRPTINSNESSY